VMHYIRLDDCLDWGCPGSDTDRANYEQAVADTIEAAYPGASVTVQLVQIHAPRVVVTTRDADGRIQIDDVTARAEEEISEHVLEIARAVWDAGEFWTEEAS
jgi:hypothetical protein